MSEVLSREVYRGFQVVCVAVDSLDVGVCFATWLNSVGLANWTVCPECGVDDFCHVEGCGLAGKVVSGDNS